MYDAASNRAPVSHRTIGNSARRCRHPSMARIRHGAVLNLRVGDRGTVENRFAVIMMPSQVGTGANVDEKIGLRKSQIQHRSERLAARDDLREPFPVRRGQQFDRMRSVPGSGVVEGGGLHDLASTPAFMVVAGTNARISPASSASGMGRGDGLARPVGIVGRQETAAASAATIFASNLCMVIGVESTSTPKTPSASLIAFAIAAGGPIAPPSPIPFWPNRV